MALRVFFMPAEPARRFAPIKTEIAATGDTDCPMPYALCTLHFALFSQNSFYLPLFIRIESKEI